MLRVLPGNIVHRVVLTLNLILMRHPDWITNKYVCYFTILITSNYGFRLQVTHTSTKVTCLLGHVSQTLGWIEMWGAHLKRMAVLVKPFMNRFCFAARRIILLKEATANREYCLHERVYMVCNNAWVCGVCQSNTHMDGRIQGT